MADYTLVAKLTADAKDFVAGFKEAETKMANLQGKVSGFGTKFQDLGKRISDVGGNLTRKITMPAGIAATAVGGLTAALGWKRLVSVDTAQGQLEGLGYSAKDVERISSQLAKALEGGMMTMGEATAAAANGMAAGVKEGKELTKYIKLLDSAVVGGTGTFDEMNQIFAQTADLGHLTANNFDMMAMRMPGFSSAMQKHMGASGDAFRDMLNSGEITLDEFLNLMDDFAGDMAGSYANTWSGMVQNTLAYIGILGENLLEGVFQLSKEEIASFIEVLSSDEMLDWASRTGEAIHNSFTTVIDTIRDVKSWYDDLSPSIQNVITKGALIGSAFLIGIGPVISVIGWLISAFGTIATVASALMGPLGLVVVGIAAIVAAGVKLYQNWETVKEVAQNVFSSFSPLLETVKGAFMDLLGSVSPIWSSIMNLFESTLPIIQALGVVFTVAFGIVLSVLTAVVSAIGPIINAFINLADMLINVVLAAVMMLFGEWDQAIEYWNMATESAIQVFLSLWEGVVNFFSTFIETIIDFFYGLYMTLVGNSIIPDMVEEIVEWFQNMFEWLIDIVMLIVDGVVEAFTSIYETVTSYFEMVGEIINAVWDYISETFTNALDFILALVKGDFEGMKNAIQNQMQNAQNLLQNIWNAIDSFLSSTLGGIWDTVKSIFSGIFSTISSILSNVSSTVSSVWSGILSFISGVLSSISGTISSVWGSILSTVTTIVTGISNTISNIFGALQGIVANAFGGVLSAVSTGIQGALNTVTGLASSFYNAGRNIVTSIADGIKGAASKVTGAASDLMSKVRGYLPFSPAKYGPLMDIHRLDFGGPIGDSIDNAMPNVQKKLEVMLGLPDQGNPHDASINFAVEKGREQNNRLKNDEDKETFSLSKVESLLQKLYDKDQSFYVGDEELAIVTNDAHDRINGTKVSLNERWDR